MPAKKKAKKKKAKKKASTKKKAKKKASTKKKAKKKASTKKKAKKKASTKKKAKKKASTKKKAKKKASTKKKAKKKKSGKRKLAPGVVPWSQRYKAERPGPWTCPKCGPLGMRAQPLYGEDERHHCPNDSCDLIVTLLSKEDLEPTERRGSWPPQRSKNRTAQKKT